MADASTMTDASTKPLYTVMCDHDICRKNGGTVRGVGVLLWDLSPKGDTILLLGKECFGRYKGAFNICCGHLDDGDDNCLVKAATRELEEEFKIRLSPQAWEVVFSQVHRRHRYRVLYVGHTPIFIGRIDHRHVNLHNIRTTMTQHINDEKRDGCWKEMCDIDWFTESSLVLTQGTSEQIKISSLVKAVLKKFSNFVPSRSFFSRILQQRRTVQNVHHTNSIFNQR